ncbi:probable insulin-like peptide 7 [Culex quinquefasciatus]|uniref:probable insulin-like peptide 7 n=1 Tax=Culex quinquefasciatus TaxID=7176 RepID=UPI0018E36D88|nr:probable insulin-like peptide 7 [Culex quinquefasciatus]
MNWLPAVTAAILLVHVTTGDVGIGGGGGADPNMEVTFRQRTRADWEKVWHQESHSRCHDSLIRHMYWACGKDIYRISRRNNGLAEAAAAEQQQMEMLAAAAAAGGTSVGKRANELLPPMLSRWTISAEQAQSFLRTRRTGSKRRSGGSITQECCTRVGCTWEEYAEYCPSNKRINRYRK